MKTYKVRIKKSPMKMGGVPMYQNGQEVPGQNEFDYGMMTDGFEPTRGSLKGSVTLKPTAADYPLTLPNANSIYDYLTAQGKSGSYASRKELAAQMGIKGYKGTAAQNLQMLQMLKGSKQDQGVVNKGAEGSAETMPVSTPLGNRIPSANYGDGWDKAPTLWESAINGPVFRTGPYDKPLPGKKEAARKAWKRNQFPGDQYQDGWDDVPAVYAPKNMFPKGATFPGNAKQTMEWRRDMIPGSYYEDGWNKQPMVYTPKNMFPAHFAYGGQMGYGLDLNSRRVYTDMPEGKQDGLGSTLGPVDPAEATYEAERGEVIVGDFDKDGNQESLTFGGKPHSQGGTPANKEGFIFSKTKDMALGGPIITEFGKSAGKKYTPAQLAKQYDLTKFKAVLDDPEADEMAKRTAQIMTDNYKKKLGKLAFAQESVKGFPQGIPQLAAEAYPELAEKMQGQQEAPGQEMMNEQDEMARYGGYYQKGGKASRYPVMDQEYLKYLNGLNNGRTEVAMPMNADGKTPERFTLPAVQSRNSSEVYGDENWWDAAHQADFKKRQAWYLDDAPGWDPRTPGATKAFQEAYNARMQSMGNQPYFGGQPGFKAADDKFGEYTYSAPGYNNRMMPATPIKSRELVMPKVEMKMPDVKWQAPAGSKAEETAKQTATPGSRLPYNGFDIANLAMAATTPVKSYAPRAFMPDVQEMQGYYDQPDYNPMLSQANTRMQMNNTFSNTGAAMAANSYNPELTQGILAETQRARQNNLQTANAISQGNTGIRNQSNAMNAQLMQDNYDKWVKTQEETDIAEKLKWRKDVMPAAQNMVNNRINMERYNMMYPEYGVTGNFWEDIAFKQGHKLGTNPQTSNYSQPTMEQFIAANPHLAEISKKGTNEEKLKIAALYQSYLKDRTSMMGKNPSNIKGNMQNIMNPYATGPWGPDQD